MIQSGYNKKTHGKIDFDHFKANWQIQNHVNYKHWKYNCIARCPLKMKIQLKEYKKKQQLINLQTFPS